ncbi:hypothetical protein CYY_003823 [Polysphondylium violaceum]|uniref:IPT/TIG domain-containing protein n=1 Tax=Polysphondylium violaceum TaxID=133409 RepID=A0A8J4PU61_9MYCE|nr:hypothetical protein CYY_003823 [Polysphondylium violaceum]
MSPPIKNFVLILAFAFLLLIGDSAGQTYVLNPANNHNYAYFQTTAPYDTAQANCEALAPSGYSSGYLTTVTSKEEEVFIETSVLTTTNLYWIAGSDLGDIGNWTYNVGPEKGQLLYNLFSDRCFSFCHFGGVEPNLVSNEHYISAQKGGTWNNIIKTSSYGYVCEFNPILGPFVPSVPTSGGIVTIDATGWDIPTLEINFSSGSSCQDITDIGNNKITCVIPPGTGKGTVTFSSGSNTASTTWQYYPPYVSIITPYFNSGEILTIVGDNFGQDASLITVNVSGVDKVSNPIPCNNIVILKDSMLTCQLTSSVTDKLLPVMVNVDELSSSSFKVAIYDSVTKHTYSGFKTVTNFDANMNSYSANLKIDGNQGYTAVIDSSRLFDLLDKSLPGTGWDAAVGARYDSATATFKYLVGPKVGQTATVYYTNAFNFAGALSTDRYSLKFATKALAKAGSSIHAITEFGGYAPTVLDAQTTYLIDTSGGTIFVRLLNFGNSLGQTSVQADNLVSFETNYLKGGIYITLAQADLASPHPITITVDDFDATPNIYYDRSPPSITSIEPSSIGTAGGVITITGTSLFNQESALSIQGITCTDIQFTIDHKQFTCTLAPGLTSQKTVTVTVDGKVSNSKTIEYQKPTITSVPVVPTTGGIITIEGTNFGDDVSAISINACTGIQFVTLHTKITCTFPKGQGALSVTLTQAGYTTPPFSSHYQYPTISSITQLINDVEIVGDSFGWDLSKNTIKMGSYAVTSFCKLESNTNIKCSDLPVVLGPFTISNDNSGNVGTYDYDLGPYITGMFNGHCFMVQDKVTMTGTYMVSFDNTYRLKLDDNFHPVNVINSTAFEFLVPFGSGIATLQLEVDMSRLSNKISFPYCPPVINDSDLVIDPLTNVVELTGKGFGNSTEAIQGYITSTDGLNNIALKLIYFNNTYIKMEFPPNAVSGWVVLNISSQASNKIWVDISPVIQSATSPYVKGSPITITGQHFKRVDINNDPVTLEFSVNNIAMSCQPGVNETTIICQAPRGSADLLIKANSKSLKGTSPITQFTVTYIKPIVLSATSTIYGTPGLVNVSVLYFDPESITVFIENEPCTNLVVLNEAKIQCLFASNIKPRPNGESFLIKVITGGSTWSSNNQVFLYKDDFSCPNDCSLHGECFRESGICFCDNGWADRDCSLSLGDMVPLPPPNVTRTSLTTIPAIKMDFDIAITHLREINGLTNKPVKTVDMSLIKWIEITEKPETKETLFRGIFDDYPTLEVEVFTKVFEEQGTQEFAGSTMVMQANSVKYQVTILSFPFASQLNTLQVIYHTKTQNTSVFECEDRTTGHQSDENMFWFKVNSGGVMMNARFSNRVYADSRVTQITISMLNDTSDELLGLSQFSDATGEYHILTALTTPYFADSVILDPNFGALLKADPNTKCSKSNSNSWKWKGPVIAVACLCAIGLSVGLIVYYRNRPTINYKMRSFTSKLRSLSRS